jgi:ClpX C4-type zinc finger
MASLTDANLQCLFCSSPRNRVQWLVKADSGALICDGCVDDAARLIDQHRRARDESE